MHQEWQHLSFVVDTYNDLTQFRESIEYATLLDDFECVEAEWMDSELSEINAEDQSLPIGRAVLGDAKHLFTVIYSRKG